jgi:hypothetical protein
MGGSDGFDDLARRERRNAAQRKSIRRITDFQRRTVGGVFPDTGGVGKLLEEGGIPETRIHTLPLSLRSGGGEPNLRG